MFKYKPGDLVCSINGDYWFGYIIEIDIRGTKNLNQPVYNIFMFPNNKAWLRYEKRYSVSVLV